MANRIIINGLKEIPVNLKPIEVDKPFIVEYPEGDNRRVVVFVAQTAAAVYQLMVLDITKGNYSLNRQTEAKEADGTNLSAIVRSGKLREYIEKTLQ